jgi:chemotaxis protein methyltransferase WspC
MLDTRAERAMTTPMPAPDEPAPRAAAADERDELAPLATLFAGRIGLDVGTLGTAVLRQTVQARQDASGIGGGPLDYYQRLLGDLAEQERLIESVLVTESWFERDAAQLDDFGRLALAHALERPGEPLRVLCAPCSHGAEAYGLAARLIDAGLPAALGRVVAVDLSRAAIELAETAHYPESTWRAGAQLPWWLKRQRRQLMVDAKLRERVEFRRANLLTDAPALGGPYEVVFSRNFLIYLTADARRDWLRSVAARLAPAGLLYCGPAEPVPQWSTAFESAGRRHALVYRCRGAVQPGHAAGGAAAGAVARPAARVPGENVGAAAKPLDQALPCPPMPADAAASRARSPAAAARAAAAVRGAAPPSGRREPVAAPNAGSAEPDADTERRRQVRALADLGQLDAAQAMLQPLLSARRAAADDWVLAGVLASARGERARAREAYERALYLDARHAEALSLLAAHFDADGEAEASRRLRQRLARSSSSRRKA